MIIENIQKMVDLAVEIKQENEALGDLFLMNIQNAMDIVDASLMEAPVNVNERLEVVSRLVGIDLEGIIKHIIENEYSQNQDGTIIDPETVDKAAMNFIINNTKDIEEYGEFLQDSTVGENLAFLKKEI